jgi:rSAM-partnered protein
MKSDTVVPSSRKSAERIRGEIHTVSMMPDQDVVRIDDPRGDGTPEWEVFLRDDAADSLRHVGSVSAPSASVAYEQASALFEWTADTLWLCPATEVARFTDRDLGSAAGQDVEECETAPARVSAGADPTGDESGGDPP